MSSVQRTATKTWTMATGTMMIRGQGRRRDRTVANTHSGMATTSSAAMAT